MLRKLARSQMRYWAAKHLAEEQGGLCPLCGKPIDMSIPREGVIDHDHDTGRIRGILHRSCNAAEGKISNAAAQWGAKSKHYDDIVAYLKSVVAYLETPPTNLVYPMHKTAEEKKDLRNKRVRERRAEIKARAKLRSSRGTDENNS